MLAFVVGLHVLGFGLARVASDAPGGLALAGLVVAAYSFGVRHAFDADHIAAIDNTTRTLTTARTRPVSVGLWFSLGHSSIVLLLVGAVAAGVRSVSGTLADEASWLRILGGLVGTAASGLFLCAIGIVNLVALREVVRARRVWRETGVLDADAGRPRGLLARVLLPALRRVGRPWHMYLVGVLFGLGFDTASEIGLLALAAGAGTTALPWYGVLSLPIVFAAGMSLFDTLDGVIMSRAYGWALEDPLRKLTYNVVVTAVSVAVALGVGAVELIGIVVERVGGPSWLDAVAGLDLGWIGVTLASAFAGLWLWIGLVRRRPASS